jgi:hypothetical protein
MHQGVEPPGTGGDDGPGKGEGEGGVVEAVGEDEQASTPAFSEATLQSIPETLPYPILHRVSRPRYAARRLAARRGGQCAKEPLRRGGRNRGVRGACGGSGG